MRLHAGCRALLFAPLAVAACHHRATDHSRPAPEPHAAPPTSPVASDPSADLPFADAGTCTLARKYFALPPKHGRCDAQACARAGGTCAYAGIGCLNVCARKTHDAGRACKDSSECQSLCLAPKGAKSGDKLTGTCADSTIVRGCYAELKSGVVQKGICVD